MDSGEITTATRSIEINGVKVKEGEVIALLNGEIVNSSDSIINSCTNLLKAVDMNDREHITLFFGEDITKEEADRISSSIKKNYPDHELEVHEGGQPHYQLILSIE